MIGRRHSFLLGVNLLALLFGNSKADESDGEKSYLECSSKADEYDDKRSYLECISKAGGNKIYLQCKPDETDENRIFRPKDCSDHLSNGYTASGVYPIYLNSQSVSVDVYCDMDTDGGGWTVIQRRGDFKPLENFYRKWNDYKHGFGNIKRDFWLGNDKIHILSTQVPVEIRFDLKDMRGYKRVAKYKSFQIDDESEDYTLHISGYSGDAGDGMKYHDDHGFSTKDRGVDQRAAVTLKGAWWIFEFAWVHLNGWYDPGMSDFQGVHWYSWLADQGLAFSEMKLRRRSV